MAWGDGSVTEDENTNVNAFIAKEIKNGGLRLDYRLWNQDRTETYIDAGNPDKPFYVRDTHAEDNNWSLHGEAFYQFDQHLVEVGGETRRYG